MRVLVHIDAILIPVSYSRQASESRCGSRNLYDMDDENDVRNDQNSLPTFF